MSSIFELPVENWDINSGEENLYPIIEQGQILFLPKLTFAVTPEEKALFEKNLLRGKYKNVSYNLHTQKLTAKKLPLESKNILTNLMSRYALTTIEFIKNIFPKYKSHLIIGRTSFRPAEIYGRKSSYRKDDSRLHVDAFPSSPNQGKRILRIFCNINPYNEARIWRIGEPFSAVVTRFKNDLRTKPNWYHEMLYRLKLTKTKRTLYDCYMLQLHNLMKANIDYQVNVSQQQIDFPAQSSWIVFTDSVSHAAMRGRFALEQTFYLPVTAMQCPEYSPLSILEKEYGKELLAS